MSEPFFTQGDIAMLTGLQERITDDIGPGERNALGHLCLRIERWLTFVREHPYVVMANGSSKPNANGDYVAVVQGSTPPHPSRG